ncbi:MAG: hypothetical protein ABSB30_13805 [Terracidiphilus sp.]
MYIDKRYKWNSNSARMQFTNRINKRGEGTSLAVLLFVFAFFVGCGKPYSTVCQKEAIKAIPNSRISIVSFSFDPRFRNSTEGNVFVDSPERLRAQERLTSVLARWHFDSTSRVFASGFHFVPTDFADVFGEAAGVGSGCWNAHPRIELSKCTDVSQESCFDAKNSTDEKRARIVRMLSSANADYGIIIWDQFGISSDGIYFVLSRTEIADRNGEIIWRFGSETEFNDKSIEGILDETFFAPTTESHFVEIHRQFMDFYPLLIKGLIEEDISGRPHRASLAKYAGVSNPIVSFEMAQVHQAED